MEMVGSQGPSDNIDISANLIDGAQIAHTDLSHQLGRRDLEIIRTGASHGSKREQVLSAKRCM